MRPQKIFRNCFVLPLFLALSIYTANVYADVVVVVSAKSSVTHLTTEQIAKIFLGKTDVFPSGGHAIPVDHAEGNAIRDEFCTKVLNKSPSQLSAYWARIIFTGDGYPPKMLDGDVAVRKAVADNPNALGYIDKSAVDSSVMVILAP